MNIAKITITSKPILSTFLLLVFLIIGNNLNSQVLLQLEINKEIEAVKFGYGEILMIKTKSSDGEWQKRKLEKLIIEENIIIFEDGMVELSDITHMRLVNNSAAAVGKLFTGFGAGWIVFGGLAHISTDYKFTWGTFAVGAVAMGVGWLFNKIVAKKTYKMGKNANLRIIDISFPEPQTSPSIQGFP